MDDRSIAPITDWIAQLFEERGLRGMGHGQRRDDLNLGLGWLYYALGRIVRPTNAVVIGSFRGFVPLVLARALSDNGEGGQVHFIDPSLVDDFWRDENRVREHLDGHGGANVTHYLMTTQEFVASDAYQQLDNVGIVFIDGYHTAEQAEYDFEAFAGKVTARGMILLHDSVWQLPSNIYGPGREYIHDVVDFVDRLKRRDEWQVLDVPFGDGVTIVRRAVVPPAPQRRRNAAAPIAEGSPV